MLRNHSLKTWAAAIAALWLAAMVATLLSGGRIDDACTASHWNQDKAYPDYCK